MKTALRIVTRMLPAYGVFPLVFSFIFNCLVYSGSRMIAGGWYHHNIETGLDRSLPFVPQFLVVYFGCYLFWAFNYILIARQERHSVYQFFTGDFISRCICLGFFLFNLAATYSPTPSPVQYHRPLRSLPSCSGWERVLPLSASPPKGLGYLITQQ